MDEDKWLLKDIRWSVRPIHLPDSEEYLYDLEIFASPIKKFPIK